MEKIILKFGVLVALFLVPYFVLTQVDWVTLLKIEERKKDTEEKLGELFWDMYRKQEKECTNRTVYKTVDSILTRICDKNHIKRKQIQLHLLEKDEVNAFALPGDHLVIFTGLITESETPEELAGVIAHEVAHTQLNHVMRKLVKEVGLSTLVAMTSGKNGQVITNTAHQLSTTAFDRGFEKEADLRAVDYMISADINPQPFADFLYKMSKHSGSHVIESWLSTHPESEERADYILEYIGNKHFDGREIITAAGWKRVKEELTTAE
jgi:beta-barrel assembly-enhancing protease